jgi:hypothetical protein
MKKFRRSAFSIACYVFAAIFAAYFVAVVISTVSTISQYYAAYQMSPTFGEVVGYLLQNGVTPLVAAILTFMAGLTYDEVRRINPANWASDDEISEAKEAKRLAKEAKQIAKGEAAKAAAEAKAPAADDDESVKPEFSAVIAEESEPVAVVHEPEVEEPGLIEKAFDAIGEAAEDIIDDDEEPAEENTEFSAVVAEDADAETEAE